MTRLTPTEKGRKDSGVAAAPPGSQASPGAADASPPSVSIPNAQYKAMRRICDPMIEAAYKMTGEEIAQAMMGFYATSETNCPWYAYALRHSMPPMLATIGHGRDGYDEIFIAASAMSAGTAETAKQAQGEARQRGPEGETPNPQVASQEPQ